MQGRLAARRHLPGQVEYVDGIGNRHLTVAQDRQQGRLAAAVETEETVAPAAIELEHRVLHELAAVESHGEIGDLDVAAARVRGQGAGAGTGLGVQPGVRLELCA